MPGYPADVGSRPEDVGLRLQVEGCPVRVRDADQIAAGGVQDALWFAPAPRRVHDIERVLGGEVLTLVLVRLLADELVPPQVPSLFHGDVLIGPPDNEHIPHAAASRPPLLD